MGLHVDAQELSDNLDLEYWLEREGVAFKKTRGASGMQLNVRECAHCGDRRYRVYLNADSGIGNCFVCNFKYNKLKFVNETLGGNWRITFDHVKEVLKEQGWRPKRTATAGVTFETVRLPASFPLPTEDGSNLTYLEGRGIGGALAGYFHLHCCESGSWFFEEEGKRARQSFDNRVIIPVFDLDGTLMTFQGRDLTGAQEPRYKFPKGLPGTGRFLLNGQNAVRVKRLCVGEGFFDVAAMKKAFDEDVALRDVCPVGTFGKHLSYGALDGNDQLGRFLQLKRYGLQEVTIMWDGEERALVAALDAAKLLHRNGIRARIALLPKDHDPNEVLPEVVREAFYKAEPYSPLLEVKLRLHNPYKVAARVSQK